MDPSKMEGSKSGGGGIHANEEFGAAEQGGHALELHSTSSHLCVQQQYGDSSVELRGHTIHASHDEYQQSSSSATNTQQSTVATAVQVAHVDIDPVGRQCAAVTNLGNSPWDVSHTGMMQPNVLPFHLHQVLLSPLAPPPTADLNLFQFTTNQQEQHHHHRDGAENWQPPRYVHQQPPLAPPPTADLNLYRQPPRHVHQQPTGATAVQVARGDIDPVGQQYAAVTNRGNFLCDVRHTGMMQPNGPPFQPFHLHQVLLPPPLTAQFPTNQQEQHHYCDGAENWQPPHVHQQPPLAPPPTADLNLYRQPPRHVHQQPTGATSVQVARGDIDPVGQQYAAVTNRGHLFQTPAHPQPLHNIPANGWGRHHAQLTIVEPGTVVNGSHARATPHTAIAKFQLSREKPYFEVTVGRRRGEMSVGVCAKSAPLNKRFEHGLHSNIFPFTATDVIGCGVLFTERVVVVIYTINGQIMGERPMKGEDVMSELYPFVTLEGPQDSIEANFEGKFTYEFKTED